MESFLINLKASIDIFISNVVARFGVWINIALIAALAALIAATLLKATLRGRSLRRPSPMAKRKPDPEITHSAAERLSSMLRYETVTGNMAAIQAQARFLKSAYAQAFNTLGMLEMDSGSMLLRWKGRDKSSESPVLFCAHLDVVPAGEGWTKPPFGGQISGGRVYGRGAIDCKGNVIALMEAVSTLIRDGYQPRRDIYFAFGHDEEGGGKQGAASIAELLGRRGLLFELVMDEGGYISDKFMNRHDVAAALIGVGEKANCCYTLTARSQGGDSGLPQRHSTLGILSEAVCRIEAAHPRIRLLKSTREYLRTSFPAMTFGKRLVISNIAITKPLLTTVFKNDPATLSMLRSTLAPTIMAGGTAENVIPSEATAVINARLLPGESPEAILKYISGLLADLPVTVELEENSVSCEMVTSTTHPMYSLLCSTLEEQYPRLPCIPIILPGDTDSRHYSKLSGCTLRFTPFIMSSENAASAHGPDEHMQEKSLGLAVEFYQSFMRKL